MIGNFIALLVLVLFTLFFGWLALRAWHSKRGWLKWVGTILAGLLTLLLALVSVVTAYGLYQFNAPRGNPVVELKVAGTPDQVARGQHLANSLCVSCHSTNGELPLSGGRNVAADSPLPIGSLVSINLTPAGPLKNWSDGEILRVLREGVDRDGHPLLVMSSNGVKYLSEEDKQAVIAYLRSQPPVVNVTQDPPDQPSLLLAAMVGAGIVQVQPPLAGPVASLPKGTTPDYGSYIADFEDCRVCHGQDLSGGTSPVAPHGPSLRVVKGWTLDQFVSTIRSGKDPTGHTLSDVMPWKDIGRLDDVELGAVYAYLKSLP